MINIIFQPDKKGWLKALGLHHALIAASFIFINHFLTFGDYAAVAAFSWYASKEYKEYTYRGSNRFEIMDFLSPALVAINYLYWIN